MADSRSSPAPVDAARTEADYRAVVARCRAVFEAKLAEYGPAWRLFRLVSVVDQIYIKARRIRQLESLGGRGRVDEGIPGEYVGILNYAVMALWHAELGDLELPESPDDLAFEPLWSDPPAAGRRFEETTEHARRVMAAKNHDYGEAWREMALESITDEILSRTVRIKSLLRADGQEAAERVPSQLVDVVNYAAFALIRLGDRD